MKNSDYLEELALELNPVSLNYSIKIGGSIVDGKVKLTTSEEDLNKVLLKFDAYSLIKPFLSRASLEVYLNVTSLEIPIVDIRFETLSEEDPNALKFNLEVSVLPEKLNKEEHQLLLELIQNNLENKSFYLWWSTGKKTKLTTKKRKILKKLLEIQAYQNEDSFIHSDNPVLIEDALRLFEFDAGSKTIAKEKFKNKLRELQLKLHPDSNTGSEKEFKYLQKCKILLEEWLEN